MNTKLIAVVLATGIAMTGHAYAQQDASTDSIDNPSLVQSFISDQTCKTLIADYRNQVLRNRDMYTVEGFLSGLNDNDTSPAHGYIAKGLTGTQALMLVMGECKKDPKVLVQNAIENVWVRFRDQAVAAISGPSS